MSLGLSLCLRLTSIVRLPRSCDLLSFRLALPCHLRVLLLLQVLLLLLLLMLRLMLLLLRHLLMLRMDLALTRLLPARIRIRSRHGLLMLSQLSIIRRPSRRVFGLLTSNRVVIRKSLTLTRSLLRAVASLTMLLRDSLCCVSYDNSGRLARGTTSTCLTM